MAESNDTNVVATRYLLGTLSEEEAAHLEEGFFADDVTFERLEVAEEELVDAYVRNSLSPTDLEQFKKRLLTTPRIVERIHFASALANKVSNPTSLEQKSPAKVVERQPNTARWWESLFGRKLSFAACIALIVVCGLALLTGWIRLRHESEQLAGERAAIQKQKQELNRQADEERVRTELPSNVNGPDRNQNDNQQRVSRQERRGSVVGTMVALNLMPGLQRSAGAKSELRLSPQTSAAQLILMLESIDYKSYEANVENDDGRLVFQKHGLQVNAASELTLQIPAPVLRPGDYTVTVRGRTPAGGFEDVADYRFRVMMMK